MMSGGKHPASAVCQAWKAENSDLRARVAELEATVERVEKAVQRDSYQGYLPGFCHRLKLELGVPALARQGNEGTAVELVPAESIRAALSPQEETDATS